MHLKRRRQGNAWFVSQNDDFVFDRQRGYDGPVMAGMVVVFQSSSSTLMAPARRSYGVDRYVMKVLTFDGESQAFTGKIVATESVTQDSDDADDVVSEEEEEVDINVEGKVVGEVLFVNYPPHRRGVDQCYTRVSSDPYFAMAAVRS